MKCADAKTPQGEPESLGDYLVRRDKLNSTSSSNPTSGSIAYPLTNMYAQNQGIGQFIAQPGNSAQPASLQLMSMQSSNLAQRSEQTERQALHTNISQGPQGLQSNPTLHSMAEQTRVGRQTNAIMNQGSAMNAYNVGYLGRALTEGGHHAQSGTIQPNSYPEMRAFDSPQYAEPTMGHLHGVPHFQSQAGFVNMVPQAMEAHRRLSYPMSSQPYQHSHPFDMDSRPTEIMKQQPANQPSDELARLLAENQTQLELHRRMLDDHQQQFESQRRWQG